MVRSAPYRLAVKHKNMKKAKQQVDYSMKALQKEILNLNKNKKMSNIRKVLEFNKAFKLEINNKPTLVGEDSSKLGVDLMDEELNEYVEALDNDDLIEVADALADMKFVLNGLIIKHGLMNCFDEIYDEVYKSNMSKLVDGKPTYNENGKVMKGKDYFKPNLKPILDKHINQTSLLDQEGV